MLHDTQCTQKVMSETYKSRGTKLVQFKQLVCERLRGLLQAGMKELSNNWNKLRSREDTRGDHVYPRFSLELLKKREEIKLCKPHAVSTLTLHLLSVETDHINTRRAAALLSLLDIAVLPKQPRETRRGCKGYVQCYLMSAPALRASMKALVPDLAMVPRLFTRSAFVMPIPESSMVNVLFACRAPVHHSQSILDRNDMHKSTVISPVCVVQMDRIMTLQTMGGTFLSMLGVGDSSGSSSDRALSPSSHSYTAVPVRRCFDFQNRCVHDTTVWIAGWGERENHSLRL